MGHNIECSLQASIKQIQRFAEYNQADIAIGASEAEVAEGFLKFNGMLGHTF